MTPVDWKALWRRARPVLVAFAVVMVASCMWQLVGAEMAVFVAGEAVWYLEAVVTLWLAARVGWLKATVPVVVLRVRAFAARLRGRSRRTRPEAPAAADDPDPLGAVWAI